MQAKQERELKKLVKSFITIRRPLDKKEFKWYATRSSFEDLLDVVGYAQRPEDKKRHDHQRRIRRKPLQKAHDALIKNKNAIRGVADFDELMEVLEEKIRPIWGIGEVYIYDTATRIGAFLRKAPKRVYLHAGTRQGAIRIGLSVGRGYLEMKDIPRVFKELQPYEIEDFLCCWLPKNWNSRI